MILIGMGFMIRSVYFIVNDISLPTITFPICMFPIEIYPRFSRTCVLLSRVHGYPDVSKIILDYETTPPHMMPLCL